MSVEIVDRIALYAVPETQSEDGSCHINPPCGACEDWQVLRCPGCQWAETD